MKFTLPGWAAEVTISPMLKPVDPFSSLSLHGALSTILGQPHESGGSASMPNFVIQAPPCRETSAGASPLRPPPSKHGRLRLPPVCVHFLHPASERLDGFDGPVVVWGAVRRLQVKFLRTVTVRSPGPACLYLRADTPLVVRQTGQRREATSFSDALLHSAVASLQRKHGAPTTRMRVDAHRGEHARFDSGWSDRVQGGLWWEASVEVDELSHLWLLVGEVLGIGMYASRGFGRYSVKMVGR